MTSKYFPAKYTLPIIFRLLIILGMLLPGALHTVPAKSQGGPDYVAGEMIVKFKTGVMVDLNSRSINSLSFNSLIAGFPVLGLESLIVLPVNKRLEDYPILGRYYKISFPDDLDIPLIADRLMQSPDVELAVPNFLLRPTRIANDTHYYFPEPGQWALNNDPSTAWLNVPAAWDITTGSSNIIVAVIDSGLDLNNRDIDGKNTGTGYNFLNTNSNVQDVFGHGTWVSGIIGAESNNSQGVAGISWGAKIMPIKVGSSNDYPTDAILSGIIYAADRNVDIINMSLIETTTGFGQIMWQEHIDYAYSRGVVIVAGSGNDGQNLDQYPTFVPAGLDHVITVGATNKYDQRCELSTCGFISGYGSRLDVMAPGSHDIYTTDLVGAAGGPGDYTFYFGGTSASTAFVSGLAALMLSINPYLNPDQVEEIIVRSAKPLGASELFGAGRIDVYKAVKCARPGDGNKDCKIDGIDYVIWLNHYDQPASNGPSDGDFNNDGKVDGIDYVIWLNNYGK